MARLAFTYSAIAQGLVGFMLNDVDVVSLREFVDRKSMPRGHDSRMCVKYVASASSEMATLPGRLHETPVSQSVQSPATKIVGYAFMACSNRTLKPSLTCLKVRPVELVVGLKAHIWMKVTAYRQSGKPLSFLL